MSEWDETFKRALAEAKTSGEFDEARPLVMVTFDGRTVAWRVCRVCRAEPSYEEELCSTCAEERQWRDLCPSRYRRHATLDQLAEGHNPWTAAEVGELRAWLENPDGGNLGLISSPGRRKTTAAFAVIRECLRADRQIVKYCMTSEMLLDLQRRRFEDNPLDEYTKPDILFLDELGDRDDPLSEDRRQLLQMVLEDRYRWERLVIWTSNLKLSDLKQWCHRRSWERLWDGATVLQIGGETTRRLAA